MIIIENLIINGKHFTKTYSDKGFMVERDGIQYAEAVDPAEFNRTYTETTIPIGADSNSEITDTEFISMLEEVL